MSDGFGLWEVFVSMFWFMLLMSAIWIVIAIIGDIFRDQELSGWGKALWTLVLIAVPWVGALVYLIFRGGSMNERTAEAARRNQEQVRAYVQDAAGTPSTADELRKLGDLRDEGVLTSDDYEVAKAKALA